MISEICPACGKLVRVEDEEAGLLTPCPHCQHTFPMPELTPRRVAPAQPATATTAPTPKLDRQTRQLLQVAGVIIFLVGLCIVWSFPFGTAGGVILMIIAARLGR